MNRNSTIKIKQGECEICAAKGDFNAKPLISGKCQLHYQMHRAKICQERSENRAVGKGKIKSIEEESVSILKKELDAVFSRWLRLSEADENGYCACFICGSMANWKECQAAHYIGRSNSFLRYDPRNVRVNCGVCNMVKDGNLVEYARRLEEENPGITDILEEEAALDYKFGRSELKDMIAEYSHKIDKIGYK